MPDKTKIRCAIYTRKSSEEGLDQDFNSLDAQREACEAFIKSQRHEGWVCLPAMYDDGGISGGTMDRPALQRLLKDIQAGEIDAVAVYKVDRLTRSLGDFAKIVEIFDQRGVSFISITQQFNTTTSMGRLTLNMLLSFAQFEREVTGERIRDKIAASKKKGMWMGGLVPLGYDACDRKLVVNDEEAGTVRHIYGRYLELRSVLDLQYDLRDAGIRSKLRIDKFGRKTGDHSFSRGALYTLLQNPVYRGLIVHKDHTYPGEHQPIVDEDLWDRVQQTLSQNRVLQSTGARAKRPSLLAGLIYDDAGERMTPTHATKRGIHYRYYVSHSLIIGDRQHSPTGRRVPAGDLEGLVESRLKLFLQDKAEVFQAVGGQNLSANMFDDVAARTAELGRRWEDNSPPKKRLILQTLVNRIILKSDSISVELWPDRLRAVLDGSLEQLSQDRPPGDDAAVMTLTIQARLKRTGMETRFIIPSREASMRKKADHSLRKLLARASKYNEMVMQGGGKSLADLAAEVGVGRIYFARMLRLSFLAPDIVRLILSDRHPLEVDAKYLADDIQLPVVWAEQRAVLNRASAS